MVFLNRIYTKSGDAGQTGLGDDTRVPKNSVRVAAYGDVDELNCVLGLYLATVPPTPEHQLIHRIQNELFDLGADLCVPLVEGGSGLRISIAQVESLENQIDRLTEILDPLKSFILPGGTPASAWLHLARTVCRRAERSVVSLILQESAKVNLQVLIYLNRLSDLFFVMARMANGNGQADILWVPGMSR